MEFHLVIALQSLHNSPDLNILIPPRRETVSIQIVRRPRAVDGEFKKKNMRTRLDDGGGYVYSLRENSKDEYLEERLKRRVHAWREYSYNLARYLMKKMKERRKEYAIFFPCAHAWREYS